MAQVTMDIAELDKLRADIKGKEVEVKEALKQLQDLRTEVALVKADKRVVVKKETPNSYMFELKRGSLQDFARTLEVYIRNGASHMYPPGYNTSDILNSWLEIVPINTYPNNPEFVNFEDVKSELRLAIQKEHLEELSRLKSVETNFDQRMIDQNRLHQDKIDKINEAHSQKLNDLNKFIRELETDKKEQTTIERLTTELEELTKLYKKEAAKKWYHKLFGL